jgi:hypothetical protein
MRKLTFLMLVLIFSDVSFAGVLPLAQYRKRPKLVLVLVIDQFRADYLTRFESRFLPAEKGGTVGGFQYLMSKGAYFPFGQYDLLQNMTGPGHATILTGAYPYLSGISLNYWFDSTKNEKVYCAQDDGSKTIEVVPPSANVGTSPKNLLGTTVGDELKNAGFPSRVFSVALKDRAAIFMGGHRADAAFWFDSGLYQWASSQFYFPKGKLPDWIKHSNLLCLFQLSF